MPKQKWLELFQTSLQSQGSSEAIGAGDALDKELAGCQFCDPRLVRSEIPKVRQATVNQSGANDPIGVPGLDQYQGRVSISF